jgi:hypothetical protein
MLSVNGLAQNRPRMILTPDVVESLRARAASGDSAWTKLVGKPGAAQGACADLTRATSGTPDGLPPVFASREPTSPKFAGMLTAGYQGGDYHNAIHNLGLCYQVTRLSNPTLAKRYAAQGVKTLKAMSSPFATATVVSSGYSRVLYYVSNGGPGGQAQGYVIAPSPELKAGTQVRIAGVLGCTAANGLRQVASVSGSTFLLSDPSGQAVICEGPGTNYNHNFMSDGGYAIRFFLPGLAIGYDWFYDELDDATKQQIWATMNAWIDEFHLLYAKDSGNPYRTRTQSNYHAAYYTAVGLSAIATRGENPRGEELYQMWRNEIHLGRDQVHIQRWLGPYGGFPEAWSYLPMSVNGMGMTLLSNWTAYGENLLNHPTQPMPWMTGLMRYYMHGTTPDLTHVIERGYVPGPAAVDNDPLRIPPSMFFLPYYLSKLQGDIAAPRYKRYMDDVLARFLKLSNVREWATLWQQFLFYNTTDPTAEWRQEPQSLATLASPAGGYGQVFMRSEWADDAVLASFMTHPHVSDAFNGKERMDKGSLLVQSGNTHLLVSPLAEAARAGNSAAWGYFSNNNGVGTTPPQQNLNYGLYYVTRPGWTSHQWPSISRLSIRSPGANNIPPDTATRTNFTVSAAQGGLITAKAHGLQDGALVYFYSSGSYPSGLAAGGVYYVREAQTDTFRVATNPGSTACDAAKDCIAVNGAWEGTLAGYGSTDGVIVNEHPTRIDRYEDQGAYVYSRGVSLETLSAYDELKPGFFPMVKWGREVLYLRPRVFVVYDRTAKQDSATNATLKYSQYMAWDMGKTPTVTSAAGAEMLRVEAQDGGAMKGILTAVLPARSTATIEDLGGYGVVHQVRVTPAENSDQTHWLTVVDASTAPDQPSQIKLLKGTNVDVVQFDDTVAAGFVVDPDTSTAFSYTVTSKQVNVHIIAGLAPDTAYQASWDGLTVTVRPSMDPTGVTTTAAGVLYLRDGR